MIWSLHGALGMADDWDDFARRVEEQGHEVRAVDLWRYVEESGLSLEEFGSRLCEEVAAEDSEPVLLGYSLGGRLGLHALLASPGVWRAAVIVSAHPGLESERERIVRMADDAQWAADALTLEWREFLGKWNRQPVLGSAEGLGLADRASLEARRRAVARGFMDWSLGKQEDLRARLNEIECPVLWLTGEGDEKFSRLASGTVGELKAGRHGAIPGAGHRVPWEAPERFAEEVGEFLGRLGGT